MGRGSVHPRQSKKPVSLRSDSQGGLSRHEHWYSGIRTSVAVAALVTASSKLRELIPARLPEERRARLALPRDRRAQTEGLPARSRTSTTERWNWASYCLTDKGTKPAAEKFPGLRWWPRRWISCGLGSAFGCGSWNLWRDAARQVASGRGRRGRCCGGRLRLLLGSRRARE